MGGGGWTPISDQELSKLRAIPPETQVSAAWLHHLIDELRMQRRAEAGPKLPRNVESLRRAVEVLAQENDDLRRQLVNAAGVVVDQRALVDVHLPEA